MKVQDLMQPNVHCCTPTQTLEQAAKMMWDNDCGCLPMVEENGRCVGVVTDRDICMAAFMQGKPLREIAVNEICKRQATVCHATDTLESAVDLMSSQQIRRLPVVDNDDLCIGIISLNDIALASSSNHKKVPITMVAETLAGICEHTGSQQTANV